MLSVEVNSVQSALTALLPTPPPSAVSLASMRPSSQSQLVNGVDVIELSDGFTDSLQEQVYCAILCCFNYSINTIVLVLLV